MGWARMNLIIMTLYFGNWGIGHSLLSNGKCQSFVPLKSTSKLSFWEEGQKLPHCRFFFWAQWIELIGLPIVICCRLLLDSKSSHTALVTLAPLRIPVHPLCSTSHVYPRTFLTHAAPLAQSLASPLQSTQQFSHTSSLPPSSLQPFTTCRSGTCNFLPTSPLTLVRLGS